jgi:hypothetical protein
LQPTEASRLLMVLRLQAARHVIPRPVDPRAQEALRLLLYLGQPPSPVAEESE